MSDAGLRRLAAATLMGSFTGAVVPDWLRRAIDDGLGSVCLFASNLTGGAPAVTPVLHDARPDLVIATDEEGGDVTRLWAATGSPVPGNAGLGSADQPGLTRRVASALGVALARAGVDLDLAPVADVNVDAANPAIGVRSFGSDPAHVATHVAAFVDGLQAAGVAACAKHFPGHGATSVDPHVDRPVLDVDVDELERRELAPFRAAIEAGVAAVMTGHLVVPALDRRPASLSPTIVDLLRTRLGFTGAIVTDALDMVGAGGPSVIPTTVVQAVAAGADLCCLGPDATGDLLTACIDVLVVAVAAGDLDADRLAEAAHRVAAVTRVGASTAPAGDLAEIGGEAARRAVRIEGDVTIGTGAHVVELSGDDMIAAGPVPWGLGRALADLDPSVTVERIEGNGRPPEIESGRPLVIAFRDVHRRPGLELVLRELTVLHPEPVLVDLGWPHPDPPAARGRVVAFGSAPPCARAAAEVLLAVPAARVGHG